MKNSPLLGITREGHGFIPSCHQVILLTVIHTGKYQVPAFSFQTGVIRLRGAGTFFTPCFSTFYEFDPIRIEAIDY